MTRRSLKAGYMISGEFIHLNDAELLKIRNLGQKGIDEIHTWLQKHTADKTISSQNNSQLINDNQKEYTLSECETDRIFDINSMFDETNRNEE